MKINPRGTANSPVVTDRDGSGKAEKTGGHFASEFFTAKDTQTKEQLDKLLADINEQGKRLGQAPTYAELKAYRELVRKFIGESVGRMYSLQSDVGWDYKGRQKMYTIIKKVDKVLADMAEDVRVGQERSLSILAKHDAIRGMLVDLYS